MFTKNFIKWQNKMAMMGAIIANNMRMIDGKRILGIALMADGKFVAIRDKPYFPSTVQIDLDDMYFVKEVDDSGYIHFDDDKVWLAFSNIDFLVDWANTYNRHINSSGFCDSEYAYCICVMEAGTISPYQIDEGCVYTTEKLKLLEKDHISEKYKDIIRAKCCVGNDE